MVLKKKQDEKIELNAKPRYKMVDGFLVPTKDALFVSTMRTGLLSGITDLLLVRKDAFGKAVPADAHAPVGILHSMVDCRGYGLVRLPGGTPASLETLSGMVPADAQRGCALQALHMPVRRHEEWVDDTALCGFDLRRVRDRLVEIRTPSCLGSWPGHWVPGYGPQEGFKEVLSRGCRVRLAAFARCFGTVSGAWRILSFPEVVTGGGALAAPPYRRTTGLRINAADDRGGTLRLLVGEPRFERWLSPDDVSLQALYALMARLQADFDNGERYQFVMP